MCCEAHAQMVLGLNASGPDWHRPKRRWHTVEWLSSTVAGAFVCILRTHTYTHTHELPMLEQGKNARQSCPDAWSNVIQEGTCFINMCVVLNIIHQRSQYNVSVAPAGPHEIFMTLSNKCSCIRSRHEDKVPVFFYKGAGWPSRGALRMWCYPCVFFFSHLL